MKKRIELETKTWDLDWNRHVTSRTYERFGYEGRLDILSDLGYSIQNIISNKSSIRPVGTNVRFLAQQFSGAVLFIETELFQSSDGVIYAHQLILDKDEKSVCNLKTSFHILDKNNSPIHIPQLVDSVQIPMNNSSSNKSTQVPQDLIIHLTPLPSSVEPLVHDLQIKYSDMNPFWTVTNEAVWKYFEEGRFLFFKEVVGFDSIHITDITTFFMGGEILIHEMPEPGSTVKIVSWIDSIEKIRFFFRQDLVNSQGRILASMRDEQLFIKVSKSRPCKVPDEFLSITKKYCAG